MSNIKLNENLNISVVHIGIERVPIIVIDDLVTTPEYLVKLASKNQSGERGFQQEKNDFYPGIRKPTPSNYKQQLLTFFSLFQDAFSLDSAVKINVMMSAFSITTMPTEKLRPIQMLPHFDTANNDQLAMVHYLCDEKHGGTAFYRHKKTNFEIISQNRFKKYGTILKQEAISEKLHESPRYIDDSNGLFERIYQVEAKMNRAVVYPSNLLHSGNIKPDLGLSPDPERGRLTISSFLLFS